MAGGTVTTLGVVGPRTESFEKGNCEIEERWKNFGRREA